MLAPPLIRLTKLAEGTNDPPVFVLTNKLHMTSPFNLLFTSWSRAEAVLAEGVQILERIQVGAGNGVVSKEVPSWQIALLHNLRVGLVWVLGARLPRYVVQMSLLILALSMAIQPHMGILLVAASLILVWSLVIAAGTVLEVRIMLRLRKQQPRMEAAAIELAKLPQKALL